MGNLIISSISLYSSLLFSALPTYFPLDNLGGKMEQMQALKPDRLEAKSMPLNFLAMWLLEALFLIHKTVMIPTPQAGVEVIRKKIWEACDKCITTI